MKFSPMLTLFTLIQLLFLISCSLEQRTYDSLNHSQSPVSENDKQRGALAVLEKVHEQAKRPILFTELGYKSTPNSATKPWEWMDHANRDEMEVSYETQSNSYQAFFQVIWSQPWFAGVHLWQYRQDHDSHAAELIHDFTPQGKPAAEVIARAFSKIR